jgi:3-oxoacyl-(acyl-carrier-protein) synthase/thioesterase domain-containing protein/SAM-dependent methyltransferase/aryl carrier-like protein
MQELLIDALWTQLQALGLLRSGEHDLPALTAAAGLAPMYDRWFQESLRVFEQHGRVSRRHGRIVVSAEAEPQAAAVWSRWEAEKARWLKNPDLRAQMALLDVALQALPVVLTGKKKATEFLFPESSLALVENVYKHNPMAEYFNRALAEQVANCVRAKRAQPNGRKLRILEIGAGTGATSMAVLERIRELRDAVGEYCYTDISQAFLGHAESAYGPEFDFLTYKILNIENPVRAQGIDAGAFDIVIAANVLHATRSIVATLRNTKSLLRRHGLLLLNEIAVNSLFNHLTFGLLEGWWLYEDRELRIPGSPGLASETWRHLLECEGFHDVLFPCSDALDLGQQIILAESNGLIRLKASRPATAEIHQAPSKAAAPAKAAGRKPPAAASVWRTQYCARIERVLKEQLSAALRIDESRLSVDEPLSSYGLDSILAVSATRSINRALDVDLDITVLFEHNTIEALQELILSVTPEPPEAKDASAPAAGAEPVGSGPGDLAAQPADLHPEAPPPFVPQAPAVQFAQSDAGSDGFAIIGVSARFAGANSVREFWQVLVEGRNCITRPPAQRVDWRKHAEEGQSASLWGGFIEGVHEFDPLFFGIAPTEAREMSPEQRLLLMSVWHAIEDAGYAPKRLAADPTGVFIAAGPSDYRPAGGARQGTESQGTERQEKSDLLAIPSSSMTSNRISFTLNLKGPSEYIDTTCSSSLAALHRAVQAMRLGECSQAIVGAVNLILSPHGFTSMASAGMLSASGSMRPFDGRADGAVRSEGVGAILLKPLQRAIADKDFIYAVVRGTGVVHGGRGVSLTAPNVDGMATAMQQAYRQAGIDPLTVSYIEAHGMATTLADSAEISALKSGLSKLALGAAQAAPQGRRCLSTLKSSIGHAEVASGMAALIKVVLAMRHQVIPGAAGFSQLNEAISLADSSIEIIRENMAWTPPTDSAGLTAPRRASINSYGITGVNAHAVIEEYPDAEAAARPPSASAAPCLIPLSAKDEERLRALSANLLAFLKEAPGLSLMDIAYTLQTGREALDCRIAIIAHGIEDLAECLDAYLRPSSNRGPEGNLFRGGRPERNTDIVELFSGNVGAILVEALLAESRIEDIARCWVKGAVIDWTLLHRDGIARRVPLPGYPFKAVPCSFLPFLDSIPASSAAPLGKAANGAQVSGGARQVLTRMASSMLGLAEDELDPARPLEDFGLNSLLLTRLLNQVTQVYPSFQRTWLTPQSSILELASRIRGNGGGEVLSDAVARRATAFRELARLNDAARGAPVFWIHGALGGVETFQAIAARSDRPFYAIQARGVMSDEAPIESVTGLASHYRTIIQSVQPRGPYDLGGFCMGGIVAYEMTRQFQREREDVRSVVMIDSPDNTGLSRSCFSNALASKNAAIQVANMLLWPAGEQSLAKIIGSLIHQSEVDAALGDEEFMERLARLLRDRGVAMGREWIIQFLKRNLGVQMAYKLFDYRIQKLPDPDSVACYYFRNRRGLFYGALSPYFTIKNDVFSLDHINYWSDWEREFSKFRVIDIESSNHMTILLEDGPLGVIAERCAMLYSLESARPNARDESRRR